MGIGLTQLVDPHEGGHTSLLPALLDLVAALVFLSVNGHHVLIKALAASYQSFPVAKDPFVADGSEKTQTPDNTGAYKKPIALRLTQGVIETAGGIFSIALRVSGPVVMGLLLSDVILGVMSRAVPQLNLFAVIRPVQFGFGMLLLVLSLPLWIWFCVDQLSAVSNRLSTLFRL
jgi:flagellar biosynthetic protein FliR